MVTKVAVVTGAGKRIGRAITLHLHALGFDIALHYRSSADSAQELADELLRKRADSCHVFQADLEEHQQVAVLTDAIRERYTSIHLLVNNASGFAPTPIRDCTEAQLDSMLHSNFRGPYFLIQGLLPLMPPGEASIINMIDINLDRPLPYYSAYTAAKAGMASLTRSLAVELGPDIRVNGVAPGAILWPEQGDSFDESEREKVLQRTPLQRMGEPMDIARTVGFLACEAPFITGQIIGVDGGWSLTG